MPTKLNPYLNFSDNTHEAMEFYKSVFGGKLDMNTFKEYHASQDPSEAEKIMHAVLETENGDDHHGGRHAEQHGIQTREQFRYVAQR